MALFESYERRIDQINKVLNSYGIASIEEAEKITKDAGHIRKHGQRIACRKHLDVHPLFVPRPQLF